MPSLKLFSMIKDNYAKFDRSSRFPIITDLFSYFIIYTNFDENHQLYKKMVNTK